MLDLSISISLIIVCNNILNLVGYRNYGVLWDYERWSWWEVVAFRIKFERMLMENVIVDDD